MVLPFQIYRHFKGNLYLVISVANSASDLQPNVVYMSLNGDRQTWTRELSEFESLVPEGRDNPTGQEHRFELVQDISSVLSQCTTENLIEELKRRPDSIFNDSDTEGLNDKVVGREYILGEFTSLPTGDSSIKSIYSSYSLELVRKYAQNHPQWVSSRTKIFKSVLVEVQSFD